MTVWSWGANSYGQLAHGHKEDQLMPVKVDNVPTPVRSIACGGGHTAFLTDTNQLWVCGSNSKGQLGLEFTEDVLTLTLVSSIKVSIAKVAAGWDFTVAVTDSGDVYSWGSNAFGQLGDPSIPAKTSTPRHVKMGDKVVQVAAGLRHSVALTAAGVVYCWGHAKRGQCGYLTDAGIQLKYSSPVKVMLPADSGKLVDIVAGSYHTAALTEDGQIVVWGCNKHGQSTQDPVSVCQAHLPHPLHRSLFADQKVKVIRTGWTHLLAQTDEGTVYSWGRGDYGQLGRSLAQGQGHSSIPAPVQTKEKIISFECGSEHCLFITDKHKLHSVGWNEHGLCGTGDEVNVDTMGPVPALSASHVIQIASGGGGHCFTLTSDSHG